MTPIINDVAIQYLCEIDPIFDNIIEKYGLPPNWSRPQGFETLVRIILEQQVSLESANAAYRKLKGDASDLTPQYILNFSDFELRACYISRQKSVYLRELSKAVLNNALDFDLLHQLSTEEVKSVLTAIKGIGHWTAEVYLIMCLQAPDLFPLGDIAALNTVKELKLVDTKEAVASIVEKWQPYRTTALFLMWHYYLKKRNRSFESIL